MSKAMLDAVLKLCIGIVSLCVLVYFSLAAISVIFPGVDGLLLMRIAVCAFFLAYFCVIIAAAAWIAGGLKRDT
jgi:hypothetical protein